MSNTDELFDNNFSFISSFISLQSHFFEEKKPKFLRAYFWGGAYYRSLISSLQQMRLLLGGAYYRGALIIGSLRYSPLLVIWHTCNMADTKYARTFIGFSLQNNKLTQL